MSTPEIDPNESADLYFPRLSRGLDYRHFDSGGIALRFARDTLTSTQIGGAVLEVGEDRFDGAALATMIRGLSPDPATRPVPRRVRRARAVVVS